MADTAETMDVIPTNAPTESDADEAQPTTTTTLNDGTKKKKGAMTREEFLMKHKNAKTRPNFTRNNYRTYLALGRIQDGYRSSNKAHQTALRHALKRAVAIHAERTRRVPKRFDINPTDIGMSYAVDMVAQRIHDDDGDRHPVETISYTLEQNIPDGINIFTVPVVVEGTVTAAKLSPQFVNLPTARLKDMTLKHVSSSVNLDDAPVPGFDAIQAAIDAFVASHGSVIAQVYFETHPIFQGNGGDISCPIALTFTLHYAGIAENLEIAKKHYQNRAVPVDKPGANGQHPRAKVGKPSHKSAAEVELD
jgi:hypothetical protein